MNKININTEFIRLSAFLKYAGVAGTGGNAKDLILDRRVSVNGEICELKGKKLYSGDTVTVDFEGNQEFLIEGKYEG